MHFKPRQFLLPILAGWINRGQQDAPEYVIMESRILREKLAISPVFRAPDFRDAISYYPVNCAVFSLKMCAVADGRLAERF